MPEHTRPSLSADREYGLNVSRFIADHRGHVVSVGPDGTGYAARRKNEYGHGTGEPAIALTLDELAARLGEEDAP
jgi:hypothetical protein